MSYFIFNGKSSEDLGLIVKKPIIRPTWSENYAEKALTGVLRKIMQKSEYYENSSMTIESYVHEASPEKMREIYSVLKGTGQLWISTAPDEVLDVIINPLVPQAVAILAADVPINVVCRPFAYALNPTTADLSGATDYTELENKGTLFSAPKIKFTPTESEITIDTNGREFTVSGLTAGTEYIIDSELQVVYYVKNGSNMDITAKSKYGFPLLHVGKNYIKHGGKASAMTVNVRERWL